MTPAITNCVVDQVCRARPNTRTKNVTVGWLRCRCISSLSTCSYSKVSSWSRPTATPGPRRPARPPAGRVVIPFSYPAHGRRMQGVIAMEAAPARTTLAGLESRRCSTARRTLSSPCARMRLPQRHRQRLLLGECHRRRGTTSGTGSTEAILSVLFGRTHPVRAFHDLDRRTPPRAARTRPLVQTCRSRCALERQCDVRADSGWLVSRFSASRLLERHSAASGSCTYSTRLSRRPISSRMASSSSGEA